MKNTIDNKASKKLISFSKRRMFIGLSLAACFAVLLILGVTLPGVRVGLLITILIVSIFGMFLFGRDYFYRGLLLLLTLKKTDLTINEITGVAKLHYFAYALLVDGKKYFCILAGKRQEKRDDMPGFSWKHISENIQEGDNVRIRTIGRFLIDLETIE